ncbi:MAG: thioredoxin domain-containing protein [Ardenticatenia bacterium]|nr:thioredoxin domain-containing protein [Ardenticatenia bacterium]
MGWNKGIMQRGRAVVLVLSTLGLVVVACTWFAPRSASQDEPPPPLDWSSETNPAALKAAEAGRLGRPAVVFFYAEWCPVCQQAGAELQALPQVAGGRLAVIRMNVDHSASRPFLRKYRVRGVPTFVLIDDDGTVLANVSGWPGRDAIERAFVQVLASR